MAGAALLGGALLYAVVAKGGFDEAARWTVTLVTLVAAGTALMSNSSCRRPAITLAAGAVGPFLLAVTVSTVAGGGFAGSGGWYAAALVVTSTLIVARTVDYAARIVLVRCVEAAVVMVAATSWWGVATHRFPWAIVAQDLWRGSSTITYANGAGAVCGVGIVVAATDSTLAPAMRRLLAMAAMVGLASTLSRGAVLATLLGLVVTVCVSGDVWRQVVSDLTAAAMASMVAVVALAPSFPAGVRLDGTRPSAHSELAVAGMAVAGLVLAVVPCISSPRARHRIVAGFGLIATVVIAAGPWREHLVDVHELALDHRVNLSSQDRSDEWAAAVREYERSPIIGVGPGRTAYVWNSPAGAFRAEFAHNEALEIVANLGIVGAAAAAAGFAHVAVSIRRTPVAAGVATIVAAQALLDFTLHLPIVLILPFAVLAPAPAHEPAPAA